MLVMMLAVWHKHKHTLTDFNQLLNSQQRERETPQVMTIARQGKVASASCLMVVVVVVVVLATVADEAHRYCCC